MINELAQQALGLAEIGGNRLLGMDSNALAHCAQLQGRIIAIQLSDLDTTLYCHPGSWGLRLSLQPPVKEADATIRGRVMALINLSMQHDKLSTSIQERVEITGDAKVAQKFQKILSELDIDWEEQLSQVTGDVIAFRIGDGLRKTRQFVKNSLDSLALSGREYLQEEAHHMPTQPEFEQFKNGVTDLRHDSDRLQALMQHILQQRKS